MRVNVSQSANLIPLTNSNGKPIAETAQCYTDAINHAVQNGLKGIELELNRLVPLMPSTDDAE